MSGSSSGKGFGGTEANHEEAIEEINIEEIMNEIRREIREKGFTEDIPSFGGAGEGEHLDCRYSETEYFDLLYEVSEDSLVVWHRDLNGSAPVVFLKKAIRKLMSFVGLPIVNDQNCFNAAVTKEFAQLAGYIRMQNEELDKCRKEMDQLKDQIGQLQGKSDAEGTL